MKTCLALLLLAALAGCSSSSNVNNAGGQCNLTQSPNACQRCWAQKCPDQLDRCFGDGFHTGELISGNTATAACRDYSVCIQACGCLDSCFASCEPHQQDVCKNCQTQIFLPCRMEKCAAECAAPDGGA
jgi:hypothetical protein